MRVRSPQDVLAGAILLVVSAAILTALSRMSATSYQAFSPALFPRLCTYGLVLGGLALLARGFLKDGPGLDRLPLRATTLVSLAVVAFGIVTPRFGYAVGGLLALIVGGLATPQVRLRELLLVSAILIGLSIVLFSVLLKLTIPILVLPGLRL
jgi:putative tricarboxylic transport membrane protein